MSGWVKLHRDLLKWEWWDDMPTRTLFIYILLKANHEDTKWHGKTIKRGGFITSIPSLSKGSGLSYQQVRSSLAKLVKTNEITDKSTNKYRAITITQWDKWQDDHRQITDNLTDKQQTNNRQITAVKEVKKERSKEVRKKPTKKVFVVPDFIDNGIWNDFLVMRKNMKRELKDGALTRMTSRLVKLNKDGYDVNEMLNTSVLRGWLDVYPKEEQKKAEKAEEWFM